jgi:hypothetical protein
MFGWVHLEIFPRREAIYREAYNQVVLGGIE